MSFKKAEKKETNTYVIEFQIEKADFDAANDRAFRKNAKNISIPGFRKGKAPRHLIEKMYGTGVFYEEAINDCLPAAYEEAAKASGLDIIGQPEFDITTIDENGVAMTAKVTIKPEVKIENYKGIKVTKDVKSVTAADVKEEIENARRRNSREVEITDRAAKKDDIANIDFDGYIDGKQFDGGKAEGHTLKLGSGAFIPGFEDQIIGKKVGEEFDVNVTFPADYHATELAGKPAVFKCKLNSLKVEELPALDDEFAKDVSEFDTLADLKKDIKARLTKTRQEESDRAFEDAAVDAAAKNMTVEIPACMIDEQVDRQMEQFGYQLQMQGMKMEDYAKMMGGNVDGLRQSLRPMAEQTVRTSLLLEAVAEAEKIEVLDEEVEEELKKMADQYQMELEKVKAAVSADSVREELKTRKAAKFIAENAKAVEEKPAKKTTKKKAAEAPAEEAPAAEAEAEKE